MEEEEEEEVADSILGRKMPADQTSTSGIQWGRPQTVYCVK